MEFSGREWDEVKWLGIVWSRIVWTGSGLRPCEHRAIKESNFLVSILSNILFLFCRLWTYLSWASWTSVCFAQPDASVDRDLLLPPRDLCRLFNVPLLWCFMALLSNSLSADCHLAWSRSLSQMHEEWEGVWGPLCKIAVSVSGLGPGLGPVIFLLLVIITF